MLRTSVITQNSRWQELAHVRSAAVQQLPDTTATIVLEIVMRLYENTSGRKRVARP